MTSPPERRIKLTLHYDGRGFHGWQAQPDTRTVQGELDAALSRLTNRATLSLAAGRTDTGVHATGQVASALVPSKWTADALERALNAVLPADVWVAAAEEVPTSFHARYDALARGYVYRVATAPEAASPMHRPWCWPLGAPLDGTVLDDAAGEILGEHSFAAFAKSGQPERGERCIVYRAEWRPWRELGVELHIAANRFLHHMVRYLVGTMVEMARGRRDPGEMRRLLAGESGLATSSPAPAAGLFLTRVYYSECELEREERLDEDLP